MGATQKCVAPESFSVSNNFVHVLYIDRKPRCFRVEWHEYQTFRCSRAYIPCSWIHQLHNNCVYFAAHHGAKIREQLPIRNVGRACNGSGNFWNWESRSRCTGTLENTAPHKIRCNIFFLILQHGDVIRAICVETTQRNAFELRKPTHQSVWFADLRIRVSNFRNCYANEAGLMTKSDLKSKTKIAAVIMKWLSQGIPFVCWNVGTYEYFWIPRSSREWLISS